MSEQLRDAYNHISVDYLHKKADPWRDFINFCDSIGLTSQSVVLDIGGGNGRNLHAIQASLPVVLDLSFELLLGYVGPSGGQKVAGSLPLLPFRKNSSDLTCCIAVLHHFRKPEDVILNLREFRRIGPTAPLIASVWRKWRSGYKEIILEAMKMGKDLDPLVNHVRPWYNSKREVVAYRFYHYYTFKELYLQLSEVGYSIEKSQYLGGRKEDANIFVKASIHS